MQTIRLLVLAVLCCTYTALFSQTNSQQLKNCLQQTANKQGGLPITIDSVAIFATEARVYANTQNVYTKNALSEDAVEELIEAFAHASAEIGVTNIQFYLREALTLQWKPLDYFGPAIQKPAYTPTPNFDAFPATSPHLGSRLFPTNAQGSVAGGLTGKTVWLSPGHGYDVGGSTATAFTTQRGTTNEVVEDFGTIETINYYLLNYLANAGANVWSVRERDNSSLEFIVNNDAGSPAYTETGSWVDGSVPGYNGGYRVATSSAMANATATFTPTITQDGYYWVSVHFVSGTNRPTDVQYTVNHAGGATTFAVNQEVHGSTWVYLGRFYFFAGSTNSVVISNQSTQENQAIIADAVRIGGGIGTQPECGYPTVATSGSGKPRFEEGAVIFAKYQGYTGCFGDVNMRPIYAEWEANKGVTGEINNAVFVSFHTNAANATARGTETYRYNGLGSGRPNITTGSTQLRDSIHKQLISDIRANYNSAWTDRGVKEANFGELRNLDVMPGTLIELAFHDTPADATDLKNAEFRRLSARAIYKGIVRFFNWKDGTPIVFLPDEPTHVVAKNMGNAQIQINWRKPNFGAALGGEATGYKVYVSTNGKGFQNGISVTDTTYTFTGAASTTYYFKIAATNAGGESFTSSVVAARTPATAAGTPSYLIVDGFDRLSPMVLRNESSVLGNVRRMMLERMNRYDYMVDHATGLASCNVSFDGCQNESIITGKLALQNYFAVDWILGEESTADRTLDASEIALLTTYLTNGGNLFISGSEIGWDIGRAASANANVNFYNNFLKASYIDDDANTYNFAGTNQFFVSQTGSFDNGNAGIYDVDFPDRIASFGGSEILLNYSGGTADGAAVGFRGTHKVVYMAFPVEAITNTATRNQLICNVVSYLTPSLPANGLQLTASRVGNNHMIQWQTQQEFNTKHFVVEKSNNGFSFTALGNTVAAAGFASQPSRYQFTDAAIWPITYYRIKLVDNDGSIHYSNTVTLKANQAKWCWLVENPVYAQATLQLQGLQNCEISLVGNAGTIFWKTNSGSQQQVSIPTAQLPAGVYWVRVVSGTQTETLKLQKL